MYREMTEEEDNKTADRSQKDAEGILIFVGLFIFHTTSHIKSILQTGLFSAAVAALLAVTVLDLKQSPQDTAAFYLENMYKLQFLDDSNASRPSTLAQPPPFSAPKSAIWVNSLWFLSLCISLTGAMLATLQQQWARRYLRFTQPPQSSPHDRARMREFFANGVDTLGFSTVVEVIPTLIHLSVFLFFAGLLIYLFNTNHSVFSAVVWWVGISVVAYLAITFMPWRRPDSPYYTPLFSIIGFLQDTEEMIKKKVQKSSTAIDDRVLKRIFETPFEDSDLVRFFESILGFCRSSKVNQPLLMVTNVVKDKLHTNVKNLLEHTWSSNFLSDTDKRWRLAVCVKVADTVRLPGVALSILKDIYPWDRHQVLGSVEMGQFLRSRGNSTQQEIGLCAQSIVAGIISNVQGSDVRWIALAADQLDKSEGDIRGYLEHGNDNVLLVNLAHITRQIFHSSLKDDPSLRHSADESAYILSTLSNFDIRNTLPGLQHVFLDLWHEIEDEPNDRVPKEIRDLISLYDVLVQGTNDASTAPSASDTGLSGQAIYESTDTPPITSSLGPVSHHDGTTTTTPSLLRVPGHTTADPADAPDATQPIPQVFVSPHSAPEPPENHGVSGDSQDVAGPAIATPGINIAVTSHRDQPTLRPIPSRVFPADTQSPTDSAMIPSAHLSHGLVSPSPASTSASSPATPHDLDPNVTSSAVLAAHDDAHGPSDPSQMELSHDTRPSDPSAEYRDQ
jgi:Family of unknown function (DUF6535)